MDDLLAEVRDWENRIRLEHKREPTIAEREKFFLDKFDALQAALYDD